MKGIKPEKHQFDQTYSLPFLLLRVSFQSIPTGYLQMDKLKQRCLDSFK